MVKLYKIKYDRYLVLKPITNSPFDKLIGATQVSENGGGANLSQICSTLFTSNFLFLILSLDVDFKLKIPHPPLSLKVRNLSSSKMKEGVQSC